MKIKKDKVDTLLTIYYVIFVFLSVFVLFLFGTTLNSTKINADLYSIMDYYSDSPNMHITVENTDETLTLDLAQDLALKQVRQRRYIKGSYSLGYDGTFSYISYADSASIYTLPVYSDKEKTEILELPLYSTVYGDTIKSGPRNGAQFASYLPSSIASKIADKYGYNSFRDLIDAKIVFNYYVNDHQYTFSVNNIYYDVETKYWKYEPEDLSSEYYPIFAAWNKNAIFAYCTTVYRENTKIRFNFDMSTNFSDMEYIVKSISEKTGTNVFDFYKGSSLEESEYKEITYTSLETTNTYGSVKQICYYVLFGISIFNIALALWSSLSLRQILFKFNIALFAFIACVFAISEILKTVLGGGTIFLVFNPVGTVATIFLCLALLCASVFLEKDEKDEKPIE